MPCNSALLAPKNSICLGLKFSSESKLFDGGPPCPCTTSATLPESIRRRIKSLGSCHQEDNIYFRVPDYFLCISKPFLIRTPAIVKGDKSLGMIWLTLVLELESSSMCCYLALVERLLTDE